MCSRQRQHTVRDGVLEAIRDVPQKCLADRQAAIASLATSGAVAAVRSEQGRSTVSDCAAAASAFSSSDVRRLPSWAPIFFGWRYK